MCRNTKAPFLEEKDGVFLLCLSVVGEGIAAKGQLIPQKGGKPKEEN
jgi:hypothetical protein